MNVDYYTSSLIEMDFAFLKGNMEILADVGDFEYYIETKDEKKYIYDSLDHSLRTYHPEQNFSNKLRQKMRISNVTQEELATITGICRRSISNYLSGSSIPGYDKALQLASALGCRLDEFEYYI